MKESRTIYLEGVTIELRVDGPLAAAALRAFAGMTPIDAEVDALPIPLEPRLLRVCVRLLRWYRAKISPRIGRRCIFEPSCSRYAELALRRHGLPKGLFLSLGRLYRCRPGAGGIDIP